MTTHAVHTIVERFTAASNLNDLNNCFQKTIDLNVCEAVLGKACLLKVRQFYVRADTGDTYLWCLGMDISQPNHTSSCFPGYTTNVSSIVNQLINKTGRVVAMCSQNNHMANSEQATIPIQLQSTSPKVTLSLFNPFVNTTLAAYVGVNMILQFEIVPLE